MITCEHCKREVIAWIEDKGYFKCPSCGEINIVKETKQEVMITFKCQGCANKKIFADASLIPSSKIICDWHLEEGQCLGEMVTEIS